jgi:hypothetical protein
MRGGEGHGRTKTVEYWLSKMEVLNIGDIKKTMQAVSGSVTQYSNIYDLEKNMIYVFYQRNYENVAVVDLSTVFQNGEQLFEIKNLDFISSSELESESPDETEDDLPDETSNDIDNYIPVSEEQSSSGCSIGGFYEI